MGTGPRREAYTSHGLDIVGFVALGECFPGVERLPQREVWWTAQEALAVSDIAAYGEERVWRKVIETDVVVGEKSNEEIGIRISEPTKEVRKEADGFTWPRVRSALAAGEPPPLFRRRGKDSGVDIRLNLLHVDVGLHPVAAGSHCRGRSSRGRRMGARSERRSCVSGSAFFSLGNSNGGDVQRKKMKWGETRALRYL